MGYGGGYGVGFAALELPPGAAEGQGIRLFGQGFRQDYPLHLAALAAHIGQLKAGRHGGGQAGAAGGPAGLPQFPLQTQGGDIQPGRGRYRRRPGKIQGILRRIIGFNLHLPVHRQDLPAGEKIAGRVVQRYRVRNLKALGVGLRGRVAGRPVRGLQHRVIGNPAFGRVSAIAAGFPIQGHRGIHLQHRRSRGIDRPLKGHHITPDAVGQRPPGRQAGEKAVEIILKAHQRRPHIFIDIMGRLPETAGGQQQKGYQQHGKGHQHAVGYGQDGQVAVGLKAQSPPFPQAAHRLHPGHQQQGGEQVDAQVDAALGRQIGQVGQQPGAAQDKDAPKVAVAEKYPGRQITGQPGSDHQAKGKGFPVNVDAAGAGRLVPQIQALPKFGGVSQFHPLGPESGYLRDDDAQAQQQAQGQHQYPPQRQPGQEKADQHGQQNQGHQIGRRHPVGLFHGPDHDHQVQGQEQHRGPAVGRPEVVEAGQQSFAQGLGIQAYPAGGGVDGGVAAAADANHWAASGSGDVGVAAAGGSPAAAGGAG